MTPSPGQLLREARHRARLSQAELAKRAGTTQSVVSAYEAGARQPSLPTLARLVSGTGLDLELRLRPGRKAAGGSIGLQRRLVRNREEILRIIAEHGLANPRLFGSVARGHETTESDVDLLVDIADEVGLFGLARCQRELERLLRVHVDLVPAEDLKPGVAPSVFAEAVPL